MFIRDEKTRSCVPPADQEAAEPRPPSKITPRHYPHTLPDRQSSPFLPIKYCTQTLISQPVHEEDRTDEDNRGKKSRKSGKENLQTPRHSHHSTETERGGREEKREEERKGGGEEEEKDRRGGEETRGGEGQEGRRGEKRRRTGGVERREEEEKDRRGGEKRRGGEGQEGRKGEKRRNGEEER